MEKPALDPVVLRITWQCVSLLLRYPDDSLYSLLDPIRQSCQHLPAEIGDRLLDMVGYLETHHPQQAQIEYVDTFDHTRKCSLHLTYFAYGDSRKRGMALLRFKETFQRFGLDLSKEELPDHLSVLCEFGALGHIDPAWKLFNDYRAGVEMLALALRDRSSPWINVVAALQATLPELNGKQEDAVRKLLSEGVPEEEVGLEGYPIDPQVSLHPATRTVSLGAQQ